jgi:multidrug efflux pump subunit AcrA (membrane-fusion protein)
VWGQYSQQEQVTATAEQARDFVPSVRVATVEASPGTLSVTLPGTTAAFAAANIFARATGYIATRNVDIGDHVKAGELLAQLAVPELDDQISQNEATLNQAQIGANPGGGQPKAPPGDLGPRPTVGRERLGDPPARRRRRPEPQGTGGRRCRRET